MSEIKDPSAEFWDGKRVTVTGGAGFLGKPTVRILESLGAEVTVPRSAEFDLRETEAALEALNGAEVVIHLAANVGGIGFNRRHPAPLVHDNMAMGLTSSRRPESLKLRSSFRCAPSAPTPNSSTCLSRKTTSGTGIRKRRTLRMVWQRR